MRTHIEVVTSGKRARRRIAPIERGADVGADNGIGMALGEAKGLLEGIVTTEHAQEVVSANSSCGACGLELPRKGAAGIVYRTAFGKLRLSCPGL